MHIYMKYVLKYYTLFIYLSFIYFWNIIWKWVINQKIHHAVAKQPIHEFRFSQFVWTLLFLLDLIPGVISYEAHTCQYQ